MDPSTPQPAGRSRRGLLVTAIVVAIAVVLVGVAWVTGGLRSASATPPQRVRPGGTVDQTRFSVQVISARTEMTKVKFDLKPSPALIVRMRVTNTGKDTVMMDDTVFGFSAGVLLQPKPYRFPDDIRIDPAKGVALSLQPRLARDIDVIWKWPGSPPQQVTLDLHKWTYRRQFDRGGYYWAAGKDSAIVSTVTVPVRQGGVG
ncbi:MAG TPA: hypothetical protein VH912_00845 [Streptosporangiaceae bacterium]|jgi:hypothetical protein